MVHTARRFGSIAAAVALAVGLLAVSLGPVTFASAGDAQVQVFDPEGPFERFVDLGRPDLSPGDQVIEIHRLLDPTTGDPAGRSFTHLAVLKVLGGGEDLIFAIDCTIRLPEGTIVFYGAGRLGRLSEPGGLTFPVTGGTGAYELVRGTVTATAGEVAGEQGALLRFDLTTA